jgi:hypothetical protein
MDCSATASPAAPAPVKLAVRPRSGNRLLLAVSGVCFLVWLVALAWLAFF